MEEFPKTFSVFKGFVLLPNDRRSIGYRMCRNRVIEDMLQMILICDQEVVSTELFTNGNERTLHVSQSVRPGSRDD